MSGKPIDRENKSLDLAGYFFWCMNDTNYNILITGKKMNQLPSAWLNFFAFVISEIITCTIDAYEGYSV